MSNKSSIILVLALFATFTIDGQKGSDHNYEVESLKDFFIQGQFSGHIRNHFMATVNEGDLLDYWSNATGAALKYGTQSWKGLQLGVKGIFTFQTLSADLNRKDKHVLKAAKWEIELYDVNRPFEKRDLDRLEELFVQYKHNSSFIKLGKVDINASPLLLNRDGRMKPFVYRGLWGEWHELDNQSIYVGWIDGVSPRGMTDWYSINDAIGLLNNGFQYDGSKADYHKSAETKGIGVLGYGIDIKDVSVQIWEYYFNQIYNTLWMQADYERKNFFGGIQYVVQNACPSQKEVDVENRYFQPSEIANVFATRFGYEAKNKSFRASSSFLHGLGTGRFLFPKELGRENFYVSQPLSWIDGYGLVTVYMLRFQFNPVHQKWKDLDFDLRLSFTDVSERDDFANNKYGRTDFTQITTMAKYTFRKKLEGLEMSLLYVLKYSQNKELTPLQTFYETNLHHFNLITNIKF